MPFTFAAICRLGHVVSRDIEDDPPPRRCPRCGVDVYTNCITCNTPIQGPEYELAQGGEPMQLRRVWLGDGYEPPPVCHRCRIAHPWGRSKRRAS